MLVIQAYELCCIHTSNIDFLFVRKNKKVQQTYNLFVLCLPPPEKQMSSVDNMVVFMKAMTAACHCAPSEENGTSLLNNNEAKALTCYVTKR